MKKARQKRERSSSPEESSRKKVMIDEAVLQDPKFREVDLLEERMKELEAKINDLDEMEMPSSQKIWMEMEELEAKSKAMLFEIYEKLLEAIQIVRKKHGSFPYLNELYSDIDFKMAERDRKRMSICANRFSPCVGLKTEKEEDISPGLGRRY